jgi:hypothetical protein
MPNESSRTLRARVLPLTRLPPVLERATYLCGELPCVIDSDDLRQFAALADVDLHALSRTLG